MKKDTIVRTALFGIVLLNMALKALGKPIISVDESEVAQFVEYVIQIAILVAGFWKNNSFTKPAQEADRFLEELRKIEEE